MLPGKAPQDSQEPREQGKHEELQPNKKGVASVTEIKLTFEILLTSAGVMLIGAMAKRAPLLLDGSWHIRARAAQWLCPSHLVNSFSGTRAANVPGLHLSSAVLSPSFDLAHTSSTLALSGELWAAVASGDCTNVISAWRASCECAGPEFYLF